MLQLLAGTKEEELQDIRSRTTTHQDSAGKNKETIDTEPYQTRLYTLKEAQTSSFPIARGNKDQVIHQQKDTTMKETTQILEELNTQKTEQEQLINEAVEMKSVVHYAGIISPGYRHNEYCTTEFGYQISAIQCHSTETKIKSETWRY